MLVARTCGFSYSQHESCIHTNYFAYLGYTLFLMDDTLSRLQRHHFRGYLATLLCAVLAVILFLIGLARQDIVSGEENASFTDATNPKKLTILYSTTAEFSSTLHSTHDAVRLALKEANYRAGAYTIELRLVSNSAETGSSTGQWSAEKEALNARRAVDDTSVVAYIGPLNSGAAQVSMPILSTAGILHIGLSTTYPGLTRPGFAENEPGIYAPTGNPTFFRMVADDTYQGRAIVELLRAKEAHTLYVTDDASTYGVGIADQVEGFAQENNLTVVTRRFFGDTEQDGTELAADVLAKNPDALFITGAVRDGHVTLLRALAEHNYTGIIVGPDILYQPEFLERVTSANKNLYVTNIGSTVKATDGEAAEHFITAYRAEYGRDPIAADASAYDAVRIVLHAVKRAGDDKDAVVKTVRSLKNFPGVFEPITFDANGDIMQKDLQIFEVTLGAFRFLTDIRIPQEN